MGKKGAKVYLQRGDVTPHQVGQQGVAMFKNHAKKSFKSACLAGLLLLSLISKAYGKETTWTIGIFSIVNYRISE